MGAYLSQPVTEKISKDDGNELLKFGASSMQGWRTSQEDAHTCLLNFDENTSLFAVFDGHGGAEVAQYCARHLPIFLKNLEEYKAGDLKSALEKAFLEFDKLLIDPSVIEELKKLAGSEYVASGEEEDEEDVNESSRLREEAEIPIEDLLARYSSTSSKDSGIVAPSNEVKKDNIPSHLKEEALKTKPISPYLRAKPGPSSSSSGAPSSSKSCCSSSTSSDPEASNRFEPCSSSSSSSSSLPNGRIPWSSRQKVGSENDSVSSSVSETVDEKNEMCRVSSTRTSEIRESDKCDSNVSESCDVVCADASNSLNECDSKPSNGETCQEKESCVSTSTDATPMKKSTDSGGCNDTSSTSIDEPTSSSKGKGKKKKVVPTKVNTPACSASSVYQAFLNDFAEDEFDSEDEFRVTSESSEEVGSEEDEEEEEEEVSSDEDSDEEEDLSPYAFLSHSGDYEEQPGKDSGCTAVVAVLKGNQLYVANAGDSRCVFSRRGRAIDMSLDHKPEDPLERRRVENAGGKVTADGRINGGLNLSRAIGDHAYKSNTDLELKDQMITAFPDIKRVTIKPERDEFMVLACDGIWNSMTSQEVVNFVRERLGKKSLSEICEDLFNDCLSPNTDGDGTGCDNMTCVIVQFCDIKPLDSQKDMEDSDGEQDKAEYQPSIVDVVKAHYKRGEGSSPERSETGPSQKRVKTE